MVKQKSMDDPMQKDSTIDIESKLRHSCLYVPWPTVLDVSINFKRFAIIIMRLEGSFTVAIQDFIDSSWMCSFRLKSTTLHPTRVAS